MDAINIAANIAADILQANRGVGRAAGQYMYDAAGGLPGLASAAKGYYGNFGTKTSKTKRKAAKRPLQKSSAMKMVSNLNYTPVTARKVKRRKRKLKGKKLNKREVKQVKRLINKKEYALITSEKSQHYRVMGCAFNKVAYQNIYGFAASAAIGGFAWTARGPSGTTESFTIPLGRNGDKLKFHEKMNMKVHNNSNFSGEVQVAHFKCLEYTDSSPFQEIEQMRDARYNQATTSLAMSDDHTQYWSVSGQKRTDWKLASVKKISLRGGEVSQFTEIIKFRIDVDRWIEEGSLNYVPGQSYILMRLVGRTTHQGGVPTTASSNADVAHYNSVATGAFRLDVQENYDKQRYVLGASDVIKQFKVPVITGLAALTSNTPVAADRDVAEVQLPKQAP